MQSLFSSRILEFQSTFPRGERPLLMLDLQIMRKFQSTFPRGERRGLTDTNPELCISIHVPAWGTTVCVRGGRTFDGISIHVPAWGTTYRSLLISPFSKAFQSTFPRGERQQISTIFHLYICISSTNSHFSITSFCIFYLIHFFLICFFQLFMVRVFRQFSVYFWFALYRNNT